MFGKKGMNREEIKQFLKDSMKDKNVVEATDDEGRTFKSVYLGSFMSLDPCGRYHHILSPNGITGRCEQFWESIEKVAGELHGAISSGEGDHTDIYFEFDFKDAVVEGRLLEKKDRS